ncbi:MAG: YARHG domain-containing protein [Pyrinomonadaceae bacterium]|nr:YARHG domain-containing protein [Pyrinomonadaceae bacterium]
MKNLLSPIVFCLLFTFQLFANDGVFYAQGDTLFPLQETQVQLKKEILKFFVVDHNFAKVDVYFEFYNPSATKTVTVGFVTPPADGDVTEEAAAKPFISNFTVNVNGKNLLYKIKRLKETTFKLETKEDESPKDDFFVYYFPVTFKKGLNIIRHTYRYRGGESVELDRDFDYQITTGKGWANKQIDDFEMQIHLDNGIFAVPARFIKDGKLADWKIVGDGKMEENERQWFNVENSPQVRMVHLNRGYLSFKATNFKPDYDITFGEYNWAAGWADTWCNYGQECVEAKSLEKITRYFDLKPYGEFESIDFNEFTAKDFKYLRNYFYAVRGLDFKDEQLRKFYSQFFWYRPDKTLRVESIKLSKAEDDFLKGLAKIESKRKQ